MGKILGNVYKYAPVLLQNIGISAYGYYWKKKRLGGQFQKFYTQFKQREYYSKEQWKEFQTHELRKLLSHAFKNIPFYKHSLKKCGFNEKYFTEFQLDDLGNLPMLTKEDLRQYGRSTLLSGIREPRGAFFSSSGSTGTPTSILYSDLFHQRITAAMEARVRNWAGIDYKSSRGMIGGRRIIPSGKATSPYYRYNFFEQQTYFSAYHISKATASDYLTGMVKNNVSYMTGYAMSNFILARFFEELDLTPPKMKAVLTSSEKLTMEMRSTLERVYRCKVFDGYSGVENCGLISETNQGQLLVNPDVGIIEIIKPDGEKAKPGEIGEVFCTGLLNYDQPLIRYRIGDRVRLAKSQITKCGRNMPVIEEIVGRMEDLIIGPDGREMVRFHGIFIGLKTVRKGQIIQKTKSDFEILAEVSDKIDKSDVRAIKERMISQLGNINVQVTACTKIPLNRNGKFKAVISQIKN